MAVELRTADLSTLLAKVMQSTFGLPFRPAGLSSKPDNPWRAAALPISGESQRIVAIAADQAACTALAAGLFQRPVDELDDRMAEDSLRELLNMVAGHIKRAMALDVALGLPEIVTIGELGRRMQHGCQKAAVMNDRMTLTIWLSNKN